MSDETTDPATAPKALRYRLLTGAGDRAFCERVSEALDAGYRLYGSPTITGVGGELVAAQAVVLEAAEDAP